MKYLFDSRGNWIAFIVNDQVFEPDGRWLGLVVNHDVFAPTGQYLGTLQENRLYAASTPRAGLAQPPVLKRIPSVTKKPPYAPAVPLPAGMLDVFTKAKG